MSAEILSARAGPATSPSDPYVRFLAANRDSVFYCKPYPGNSGDQLIMLGTQLLLERLRVPTTLDPAEADVILIPGGNPGLWPACGAGLWREVWRRFPDKRFVVGPAGFAQGREWRDAVRQDGACTVALFAREPRSFSMLESAGLAAEITIGLSHDPALHLRDAPWLEAHRNAAARDYVLLAFRDDFETNAPPSALMRHLPYRWRSRLERLENGRRQRAKVAAAKRLATGSLPMVLADASKQNFHLFLETVRRAAQIHTDRLHVMLLGAMLGKKVFAYSTSYGKLEAVYEHSLRGWADVELVADRPGR